jgi:hypothetical protein
VDTYKFDKAYRVHEDA